MAHGPCRSEAVNEMSSNDNAAAGVLAQHDDDRHANVAFTANANAEVGPISRFAKIWNVLSSAGNTDSDKKAKKKAKKAAYKEKQTEEKKCM